MFLHPPLSLLSFHRRTLRLWYDSMHKGRQLKGIGESLTRHLCRHQSPTAHLPFIIMLQTLFCRAGAAISERFVAADLTTLDALRAAAPERLEKLSKRQAPFIASMLKSLEQLPELRLEIESTDDISMECCRLEAVLRLCNPQTCKVLPGDAVYVLAKDAKGKLIFVRKHK